MENSSKIPFGTCSEESKDCVATHIPSNLCRLIDDCIGFEAYSNETVCVSSDQFNHLLGQVLKANYYKYRDTGIIKRATFLPNQVCLLLGKTKNQSSIHIVSLTN